MKTYILSLVALVCSCVTIIAGPKDKLKEYYNSYNVKRGIELYNNGEYQAAQALFEKEIQAHSDNGYAHFYIALINSDEYSQAIESYSKAIKYLKDDIYWQCFAYRNRGEIYNRIGNKEKATEDYNSAVARDPQDPRNYYGRGNYYYNNKQYDLSDKDYEMLNKLNIADFYGYTGRGRNAIARGNYKEAIKLYDKAEKLNGNISDILPFRAEAYIGEKNYFNAASDIVRTLAEDSHNAKAINLLDKMSVKGYKALELNIRAQMNKQKGNAYWPWLMARINLGSHRYEKAIEYYNKTQEMDAEYDFSSDVADCYVGMGKLEAALTYINQAIEIDSTVADNYYTRADIYYKMGDKEKTLTESDLYIVKSNSSAEGYLLKGLHELNLGMYEEAYNDIKYGQTHDPKNSAYYSAYLMRVAKARDNKEDMEKECNAVIEAYEEDKCSAVKAMFAYAYLGEADKAIGILDNKVKDEDDFYHYDAACLYSVIGDLDKSLEYLRMAYETGFVDFNHARCDYDLVALRRLSEFEQLTSEYELRLDKTIAEEKTDVETAKEIKVSEIPFVRESGVCKVKCAINGLPLYFYFDTGASDISISSVEASFMFKNEYISKDDIVGTSKFITADGSISEGTIINLKEVQFGDKVLRNVKASVVNNQHAPLLLGQSVFAKLGKIEIDNENKSIKISYTE